MAAGLATLNHLTADVYAKIGVTTDALVSGIMAAAEKHAVPLSENHVCEMFGFFFTDDHVTNYDDVAASNVGHFNAFFHEMLAQGIYLAPSAFEAGFLSAQHGEAEIESTLQAADVAFAKLAQT